MEADLVLHCGASLQGEFVHSLTAGDVFTGWVIEAMTQIQAGCDSRWLVWTPTGASSSTMP